LLRIKENCTLAGVELESGSVLSVIGTSAFSGCTILTSINLPGSLEEIKENAFNNTGFFAAAPADGVVYAGKNVIYGAGGAATFAGGSGGWAVGVKGTVSGTVTVADGTRGLIMRAFYNKTAITVLNLPSSLRYIGERSLEKISITQITIPEGVVYVGSRAFQSVTTLQTVSVPSTTGLMRGYAFDGCTSLTTVYINRPSALGVTAIQVSTFNGCSSLTHLYVPDDSASEAAYKSATNWKSYAAKISAAP